MRPDVVVLFQPQYDDDLSLLCCCEPLGIEHLMAQSSIEAFIVSVFPGRAWIDLDWFDPNTHQPVLQRDREELRTIVRTNIFWLSMLEQQWIQRFLA